MIGSDGRAFGDKICYADGGAVGPLERAKRA